ncbi:MAG: DUF4242 domain-containing protein [Terrimonas sp.]|nr:DUF4242 domain-containing protein [Terrimonas sp.]
MPLFMDFHKIDNVTIEDVKTAHIADKAIQNQFGVRYHQFWVNQEAGTVFCLMEGPDAKTCEKVHQMAHGNIACALTEVEPGFYEKMMGSGHKIVQGHVQHEDGTTDTGYRTIVITAITGITNATSSKQFCEFKQPSWAREVAHQNIYTCNGRALKWEIDDSIIAVFDDPGVAVAYARKTQEELQNKKGIKPDIIFRIGISTAQPVTADGDFFKQSIKLAHRLCMIAAAGQIVTSSLMAKLSNHEQPSKGDISVKSLNFKEEDFISTLITVVEKKIGDEHFNLNSLSAEVCVSRPQLYRKIIKLTGLSPNDFIRDLRMNKALSMLKEQKLNISEVAYETGFSSPAYFSRCFAEKFGVTPSVFLKRSLMLLMCFTKQLLGDVVSYMGA